MTIDGTWNTTMQTPAGPQTGSIDLRTQGSELSGTMHGPEGPMAFAGTVDGNDLAWSIDLTKPMPMTLGFTAKIDGDALAGEVKLGSFGTAALTGTRA
jgi:hypothetical protein